VEEVFVPISDAPVGRRSGGEASEGERGSEDVFAEAGVSVFRVEGIEQDGVTGLAWSHGEVVVEFGRFEHGAGTPEGF